MKFADRVTCMLEGRLVLEGSPGEISSEEIFAAYFGV
jgi:ABC-type branched-subunit amino acid transport system ATPase component